MLRRRKEREKETILAILAERPGGMSRKQLEKELEVQKGVKLAWRTLLRRLEELAEDGKIDPRHGGTRRVYRVKAPAELAQRATAAPPSPSPGYVPLTGESEETRRLIRQPRSSRQPVGYNESWVREYRVGESWYLSENTRKRLKSIGESGEKERPAGTYARDILDRLLIDLAWASSRLEGNTYSLLDTKNLLEHGEKAEGKDQSETQMILNHKRAIEFLVENVGDVGFDLRTFQALHVYLSENLLPSPEDEGRLRRVAVEISGSTYVPLAIPQKIEEMFRYVLATANAIEDPFEQAFFLLVHIPYLQPFRDVNKRTSRLGANIPLIKGNFVPLSFIDVPEMAYTEGTLAVYELNRVDLLRDVFIWAYERSAARLKVVRDALPAPDQFRNRYREQLIEVVNVAVSKLLPPTFSTIRGLATTLDVPEEDSGRFVELGLGLLVDLHEGQLSRYRLRESQLATWKEHIRSVNLVEKVGAPRNDG